MAFAATVALAAGFTYLAVRGVNWSSAWHALERCDAWWLVPAMVAFAAQTLMRAMRWRSLFARGRRPAVGPIFAATMIGYLFNNIMPARAGEVARVVALAQRTGDAGGGDRRNGARRARLRRLLDPDHLLLRVALAAPSELVRDGRDPGGRRRGRR